MSNEILVQRIKSGYSVPDDMQKLYENNLPLIKKFIKPFANYGEWDDILQESFFGLWEAVQHYEASENVLFMTYARFWIVQSVQRYLEKCGSVVYIPPNTREKFAQLRKVIQKLEQEQNREPKADEIADLMGISVENLQEIQSYMQSVSSLDSPISDDSSLALVNTLQADFNLENDVIDKTYNEHCKNELWAIVERYTAERENLIIREIFINNQTMAAVARNQGISLGRVRQIKEKGLRKLRRGRARRELLEKLDIADTMLYRGGLNDYKEKGCSIVERITIKRIEVEERYQKHLAEIEEMHRQRLLKG